MKWKVVKDLEGMPSHEQGGVQLSVDNGNVHFAKGKSKIHAKYGMTIPPSDKINYIHINDPNDKNYIAYKDSLDAYRYGNRIKKDYDIEIKNNDYTIVKDRWTDKKYEEEYKSLNNGENSKSHLLKMDLINKKITEEEFDTKLKDIILRSNYLHENYLKPGYRQYNGGPAYKTIENPDLIKEEDLKNYNYKGLKPNEFIPIEKSEKYKYIDAAISKIPTKVVNTIYGKGQGTSVDDKSVELNWFEQGIEYIQTAASNTGRAISNGISNIENSIYETRYAPKFKYPVNRYILDEEDDNEIHYNGNRMVPVKKKSNPYTAEVNGHWYIPNSKGHLRALEALKSTKSIKEKPIVKKEVIKPKPIPKEPIVKGTEIFKSNTSYYYKNGNEQILLDTKSPHIKEYWKSNPNMVKSGLTQKEIDLILKGKK